MRPLAPSLPRSLASLSLCPSVPLSPISKTAGAPSLARLFLCAKGGNRCRTYAIALAFLLILAALPARAQFEAPNPAELKMTSDPKAPGAAAIYLDREETTEKGVLTIYARIKVLTEQGKELSTVRIPFVPNSATIKKIEGRTIHPDGSIYLLTVKPEDLLDVKTKYFQEDTLVFTLPAVDVGSILEYRIQMQPHFVPEPHWELQLPYYIRKEHFSFKPDVIPGFLYDSHNKILDRLMYQRTPVNAPVQIAATKDTYTADASDVPPLPNDDWMPPINTLRWRAQFYYTYAHSPKEFWDTELKFWQQDVEEFIHLSGTIKKAAASLVSETDTDDQKARKIYAAVMKLDNTDFSRVKSEAERKKEKLKEIRTVEDVWKNQSGPGNSIALLYVALARAAGLKVWPMQVVDRSHAIFDMLYFSTTQLEDYIAVVNIGGKDIFVDPGQKACPFGVLHWAHTLSGGFRESAAGPVIAQTHASSYKDNGIDRSAFLTVDPQGNVTGEMRIVMRGAVALEWRQLSLQNDPEEVKKQFNESVENDLPQGVRTEFDHFLGMDDYESNLVATLKVSGTLGASTGKHMFLPGLFFETRAKHPFVAEQRTIPIDVQYPRMETDDVIYNLPAGYTAESAPRSDVTWPSFAVLKIDSKTQPGSVEVARTFGRGFTLLGPEAYNNLHDFYSKLATADQQQIVLDRTAVAKGN